MTLTDKDKLIRELRINPAGCEECEYADSKLNCTRGFQFASACESICEAVEIDAVPVVHGKWIDVEHAPNDMWYCTCSVCGERQTVEIANYCPICGADMRGKEEK